MLKKLNNDGYILLESIIAFMLLTSLILVTIPLLIFLKSQQVEQSRRLEAHRFLYELTQEFAITGSITTENVLRQGDTYYANWEYTEGKLSNLTVEIVGKQFVIDWQDDE